MARKATAQDVADLAGVSRSAVSLVLNGRAAGNISPRKQAAVLAAAAQLAYTPNAVALSLRSRRTRTLGVLTWPGRVGLPQAMLHAALRKASEHSYLLLVMDTNADADLETRQLDILRDRQVDGFLVVSPELVHYRPAEVLTTAPTVLVNCLDPDSEVSSVAPDEVEAGRHATEVLLRAGHRRIGLVVGDPHSLQTQLRVAGVQQAATEAGRPGPAPAAAGRSIEDGYRAARSLLLGPDRPTALICTHERLSIGAALVAAELGVSIPSDLSLVSLEDGEGMTCTLVPPLTTVHRPDAAMAEQAVKLLLGHLGGDCLVVRELLFASPLRPRASVGCPGQA
ncbi:MAG: Transcriptional regulator, LacI family [uncultured Friedmanniella sp.]|uniref:Transcriptional regulator, LacI family n=1 Tax=uncultured Friedmanniella sp. TaxID=335381 RepID=A0A6J4K1S3_9ACTN|nr:LacI family DNA-binding transcriptional regulator [uncultured Friedmanniella sp.]CAA9293500.1 MAG: Transcriptional regulator, LacI family [uncultured Friedmanniella sp.]